MPLKFDLAMPLFKPLLRFSLLAKFLPFNVLSLLPCPSLLNPFTLPWWKRCAVEKWLLPNEPAE